MSSFIYVLQDLKGNVRYVGQTRNTLEKRFNQHISLANRGGNCYSSRWIRKCITEGFLPIMRVIETIDEEQMQVNLAEMYWISRYKREGARLTNETLGGEGGGMFGKKMSSESRIKMSISQQARKHKPCSEETKAKIAATCKTKGILPPMHSTKGSKKSDATKARMKQAWIIRKQSKGAIS